MVPFGDMTFLVICTCHCEFGPFLLPIVHAESRESVISLSAKSSRISLSFEILLRRLYKR